MRALLLHVLCHALPAAAGATSAAPALAGATSAAPAPVCLTAEMNGPIEFCCVDAATTDAANAREILPILDALSRRTYFRYFKVNLWRACPFWDDDGVCLLRHCAVCECEPNKIPECWRDEGRAEASDAVSYDARSGPGFSSAAWSLEADKPSLWSDEGDDGAASFVDLLANPEAYTAYGEGESREDAARAWAALHAASCFEGSSGGEAAEADECLQEHVFSRLLSGLQASISTHIALTYNGGRGLPDAANDPAHVDRADGGGGTPRDVPSLILHPDTAPNTTLFVERVGAHPRRLSALYFTYLFVARAVAKAAPVFSELRLDTGDAEADASTASLLRSLSAAAASPGGVGGGFDEGDFFATSTASQMPVPSLEADAASCSSASSSSVADGHPGGALASLQSRHVAGRIVAADDAGVLIESFRRRYRNISRVLDCVGCERCRLWGKLQYLGLGTAMKVLFAEADARASAAASRLADLHFARNELVALINVFHALSVSVAAVGYFREDERARSGERHVEIGVTSAHVSADGELGAEPTGALSAQGEQRDVGSPPTVGPAGATMALQPGLGALLFVAVLAIAFLKRVAAGNAPRQTQRRSPSPRYRRGRVHKGRYR